MYILIIMQVLISVSPSEQYKIINAKRKVFLFSKYRTYLVSIISLSIQTEKTVIKSFKQSLSFQVAINNNRGYLLQIILRYIIPACS